MKKINLMKENHQPAAVAKCLLALLICCCMLFSTVDFPAFAGVSEGLGSQGEGFIEEIFEDEEGTSASEETGEEAGVVSLDTADSQGDPTDENQSASASQEPSQDETTGGQENQSVSSDGEAAQNEEQSPALFIQETAVNGVQFIISAEQSVVAPGEGFAIEWVIDEELESCANEAISKDFPDGSTIIYHNIFQLSGAPLSGKAHVRMQQLGFEDWAKEFSGASLSVYVLSYHPDEESAADRITELESVYSQDRVTFDITGLGEYDVAAVLCLPTAESIAQPEPETVPESETIQDASDEPDEFTDLTIEAGTNDETAPVVDPAPAASAEDNGNSSESEITEKNNDTTVESDGSADKPAVEEINEVEEIVDSTNTSGVEEINEVEEIVDSANTSGVEEINEVEEIVDNTNTSGVEEINEVVETVDSTNTPTVEEISKVEETVDGTNTPTVEEINEVVETVDSTNTPTVEEINEVEEIVDGTNTSGVEEINEVEEIIDSNDKEKDNEDQIEELFSEPENAASFEIVKQPENAAGKEGDEIRFIVEAKGKNLSYQWQWSSDSENWKEIGGSSKAYGTGLEAELSFTASNGTISKQYRCVVSNGEETLTTQSVAIVSDDAVFVVPEEEIPVEGITPASEEKIPAEGKQGETAEGEPAGDESEKKDGTDEEGTGENITPASEEKIPVEGEQGETAGDESEDKIENSDPELQAETGDAESEAELVKDQENQTVEESEPETGDEEPPAEEIVDQESVEEESAPAELPEDRKANFVIEWDDEVPTIGSIAHFKATLENYDTLEYTLQWQYSSDGVTWNDVDGATDKDMDVEVTMSNYQYYWRLSVYVIDVLED